MLPAGGGDVAFHSRVDVIVSRYVDIPVDRQDTVLQIDERSIAVGIQVDRKNGVHDDGVDGRHAAGIDRNAAVLGNELDIAVTALGGLGQDDVIGFEDVDIAVFGVVDIQLVDRGFERVAVADTVFGHDGGHRTDAVGDDVLVLAVGIGYPRRCRW